MKKDAKHVSSLIIHLKELAFRHSIERLLQMPATGYRSAASGVLGAVGADSHAWASSSFLVGSYTAGNYYGGATRMVPLKDDNRAYGFPVRCVQHLPKLLLYWNARQILRLTPQNDILDHSLKNTP